MNKNDLYIAYETKIQYLENDNSLLLDKEYIKLAIKNCPRNLKYVSKKLLEDKKFLLELYIEAFKILGKCYISSIMKLYYDMIPDNIKKDDKFLLKLIKIYYLFFFVIPKERIMKKNVITKIITSYPDLICSLSNKFFENKDLILLAIKSGLITDITFNLAIFNHGNICNEKDIKFKLCNLNLRNCKISQYIYNIYFSDIKRFDIFEFIRKNNTLEHNAFLEIKIVDTLISKISNINILPFITRDNDKKKIINYLCSIKLENLCGFDNWKRIFFNKIYRMLYENFNDIIVHLLKNNDLIFTFIKKNGILHNNKVILKTILNKFISNKLINNKLYFIYKYDYHSNKKIGINNINYLFYLSNKFLNLKKYKYKKKYLNNYTMLNKKLSNKLIYYSEIKHESLYFYNKINMIGFNENIKINIMNDLNIFKLFVKDNIQNFLFYDEIRKTKENVLYLIKNGCNIFEYIRNDLVYDLEIIYHSLKLDITQIRKVNIDFVNEYVKQNFDLEKTFEILKK